jgi:hypothetical protein
MSNQTESLARSPEAAVQELWHFVKAERFNREHFPDDTAFADWVQCRARHTLKLIEAERVSREAALDAMVANAQDLGLYDDSPPTASGLSATEEQK